MKGIKATVTMERTLYIDVPENATEEQILELADKEIILPINALSMAEHALRNMHVKIPNLDLKDWEVTNVSKEILKDE
jgi:hypothetical protein